MFTSAKPSMMMTSASQELLQAGISDMHGASRHHSMQQGMDDSRDERSHTGSMLYSGMR